MRNLILTILCCALLAPAVRANLITVNSQDPAVDEGDAIAKVTNELAIAALPTIRKRVDAELLKRPTAMIAPTDEQVKKLIIDRITSEEGALCVRAKPVTRTYGTFYFGVGEISLADDWVDKVVKDSVGLAKIQQQKAVNSVKATGALMAVIGLIYFAANALTKGYYQWRLRLAAAAGSMAGIAAVIAVYFGV